MLLWCLQLALQLLRTKFLYLHVRIAEHSGTLQDMGWTWMEVETAKFALTVPESELELGLTTAFWFRVCDFCPSLHPHFQPRAR